MPKHPMTLDQLLHQLHAAPESVSFADTIKVVDENFEFTETSFQNGELYNAAGENNGSCKIFYFGKLQHLSPAQTLACFGDYYRIDVLQNPDAVDHQNIRNFIKSEWNGVRFDGKALEIKS